MALMGMPSSRIENCDARDYWSLLCIPAPILTCVEAGLFHTGQTDNNKAKSVLAHLGFTASKTKTVFSGFPTLAFRASDSGVEAEHVGMHESHVA